ncbi:MAG: hypothetical protein EBQ51_02140 [Verrucomicrobia bacterium]|nr:hypothetical protein [Pseudomonadota bacterium]NBS07175.1 hypothetical protein [Verrucomicrobiota bacterium]NBS49766.1 hypothetical protein [Verrucomicrobiota bacterium]NBS79579.1 hypothetical protein [bacterium]NBY65868.1 hypothetical protein [Verrucomicrobiota bacterium]
MGAKALEIFTLQAAIHQRVAFFGISQVFWHATCFVMSDLLGGSLLQESVLRAIETRPKKEMEV